MGVDRRRRVYCAGPLFNQGEQEEMQRISHALSDAGYDVFLPQRDGILFDRALQQLSTAGFSDDVAKGIIRTAIFCLDAYEVIDACDALVANFNGRVPDEGAVAEAAWAWLSCKPVIAFKADSRSLIHGEDNPLLAGLVEFRFAASAEEVVRRLREAEDGFPEGGRPSTHARALEWGRRISEGLRGFGGRPDYVQLLSAFAGAA